MLPPAPALFSTTNCWPYSSDMLLRHHPRQDVGGAAGRERHHEFHRPARPWSARAFRPINGSAPSAAAPVSRVRRLRRDGGRVEWGMGFPRSCLLSGAWPPGFLSRDQSYAIAAGLTSVGGNREASSGCADGKLGQFDGLTAGRAPVSFGATIKGRESLMKFRLFGAAIAAALVLSAPQAHAQQFINVLTGGTSGRLLPARRRDRKDLRRQDPEREDPGAGHQGLGRESGAAAARLRRDRVHARRLAEGGMGRRRGGRLQDPSSTSCG